LWKTGDRRKARKKEQKERNESLGETDAADGNPLTMRIPTAAFREAAVHLKHAFFWSEGWGAAHATVRQILNRIVSQHNNSAWVVQQPPWNMDKEPSYGLWRLFEYDGNNGAKFSALLQVWGLGLHGAQ
jgi:hypothetical protein